jgi:hypothetical protein
MTASSLRSSAATALLAFALLAIGSVLSASENRTWKSADGERSFEGRLREYSPDTGQVTVVLSNGQPLSFSEEVLSEADRKFLAETGASGGAAMVVEESSGSLVREQLEKTRLHRLDGRRYRRAEIEKTPEFYLFYYSASW